jgi:hypothetical protein
MLGPQTGIELAEAAVAVDRHRDPAARARKAQHRRPLQGPTTVPSITWWSKCSQTQRLDDRLAEPKQMQQHVLEVVSRSRLNRISGRAPAGRV